ncbi:MAG: DUF4215 domain-containing protein [Polyangiaceae bacterium]|nr:DUF4215 domain-containing protein [Polyangiaceae bacterium]
MGRSRKVLGASTAVTAALFSIGMVALPSCGTSGVVCGNARVEKYSDDEKASDPALLDEECDDGNLVDNDDCTNACRLPRCHDGIVQEGNGEECEDGDDADSGQDVPQVDTDGCTFDCKLNICGDGTPYQGVEECDDGNLSNTDDCLETCLLATCGDGFVHLTTLKDPPDGVLEDCDDANDDSTDNCTVVCKKPACGDGFVQGAEECDDGNENDNDSCPSSCTVPICGDGFVDAATEECDDGNTNNADACKNDCTEAACGDGVLQVGVEECDDSNLVAGDFCSPICNKECFGDASGIFEGRCYQYFPGPLTWNDANCGAFGSHMVTIESSAENTFVQGLIPAGTTDSWIGLTDQTVESVWVWQLDEAGDQVLFPALLKWGAAQPDNLPAPGANCAILSKSSGLWFDEPCADARGFVCEHEFPE